MFLLFYHNVNSLSRVCLALRSTFRCFGQDLGSPKQGYDFVPSSILAQNRKVFGIRVNTFELGVVCLNENASVY